MSASASPPGARGIRPTAGSRAFSPGSTSLLDGRLPDPPPPISPGSTLARIGPLPPVPEPPPRTDLLPPPPIVARTDSPSLGARPLGDGRGIRIGIAPGRSPLDGLRDVARERASSAPKKLDLSYEPPAATTVTPTSPKPPPLRGPSPVGRLWPEGTLWSSVVERETLAFVPPQDRKRQEIIFELISTERRYVEDLIMIITTFLQPLQQLLKPQEHGTLFINLKDLYPVNQSQGLLKDLEDVQRANHMVVPEIGPIILKWCNQFKLYAAYCANSQSTKKNVDELRQRNEKFATFLDNMQQRPECRGLNLEALLIKPVQRICKYPLLLKDLLKATSEADSDYASIGEALKSIQQLVDKINERTRRVDNAKKIDDIQNAMEKKPKDLDLQSDLNRLFVREGHAKVSLSGKKAEGKDLYLFLFSDMIVITKKSKEKHQYVKHAPLINIRAVDIPEWLTGVSDTIEIQYPAEGGASETMQFEGKELKNAWLSDLNKAIEASTEKQQEQAKLEASLQLARLEKQKSFTKEGEKVEVAEPWRKSEPVAPPGIDMSQIMQQLREMVEENRNLKAQIDTLQKELQEERQKRREKDEYCQRWHS